MTILPSLSLLNQIDQFIQRQREGKFSLNYGLFLLCWKSGLRVSEAVNFDYQLKHSRHKDLYLVKGKGNKKRYIYVSPSVINKLKTNHWQPNKTSRFTFYNFLKKIKEKLNISQNVELTPHTLRRCFTTYNALNGVPIPILQKALGHANIRITSGYWKGSVDIREFGEWLKSDSSPKEPKEVPGAEISPIISEIPVKLAEPNQFKETELLKTVAELKKELEQKDQQLAKYKERLKQLSAKNNSLLQNYSTLKNTAEKLGKNRVDSNQTPIKPPKEKDIRKIWLNSGENPPNTLFEIKEQKTNSLTIKEKEAELLAQIQVWKPPN